MTAPRIPDNVLSVFRKALATIGIAIGTAFVSPPVAAAFDVYPEYHSLTEAEAGQLDRTSLIDSEYQSDVVTYSLPFAWDARFYESPRALEGTIGSLTFRHFLQHTRARFEAPWNDGLKFRFIYFQQRDFETDQTHVVFELEQDLSRWLGGLPIAIAAYGEPSHFKRENDFGLALLVRPSERHVIRVFNTEIDFTRELHNDLPDTFVEGYEPFARGIVGRCSGCFGQSRERGTTVFTEGSADVASSETTSSNTVRDWLEYYARWETPVRWRFPQGQYEYSYENFTAGVSTRFLPRELMETVVNVRAQVNHKFEGRAPSDPTSSVVESTLDRKTLELLASFDTPIWTETRIEPGLGWFHRLWRSQANEILEHRNLMPFLWLYLQGPNRGEGRDRIDLGYEVTFFSGQGTPSLSANELKSSAAEHRLNLRYTLSFRNGSQLTLGVAADADVPFSGGGGVFEGGNGQLRAFF